MIFGPCEEIKIQKKESEEHKRDLRLSLQPLAEHRVGQDGTATLDEEHIAEVRRPKRRKTTGSRETGQANSGPLKTMERQIKATLKAPQGDRGEGAEQSRYPRRTKSKPLQQISVDLDVLLESDEVVARTIPAQKRIKNRKPQVRKVTDRRFNFDHDNYPGVSLSQHEQVLRQMFPHGLPNVLENRDYLLRGGNES